MTINKVKNGSELILELEGRLDTTTAPQLDAELNAAIEGVTSLVFDLKGLSYLSSAGLRILLSTQKKMNVQGSMVIRNVNETIAEIFSITGFTDILNIE